MSVQADTLVILREWGFTKLWDDSIFQERKVFPFLFIVVLSILEELLENCAEGRPLVLNALL